ncbi:MAG: DUF3253 domain-containing protein [Rhodobacteraceae bacterium]|nr:DUF3253 domain-containing protein [Paracoccaceae bacterium]
MAAPDDAALRAALLAAAARRAPPASFCPSEVARALSADWRPLMPRIRAAAAALQAEGLLHATQRGRPVDAAAARGPIRLSRPPG